MASNNKMISMIEKIDLLKLQIIVGNYDKLKEKIGVAFDAKKKKRVDFAQTKTILKKYLKSKDITGSSIITYDYSSKSNDGRLFSQVASLQGLPRVVRHTIAKEFYWDIDIKNAHPVIFKWYCDDKGVKCDNLTYYINNRDECLADLMDKCKLSKDNAKSSVLALINGGIADMPDKRHPDWYNDLFVEIQLSHEQVAKNYPKYVSAVKRQKGDKTFNINGKVCNKMFCHYEGIILNHMADYCKSRGLDVGALCFDGLMIYKKENFDLSTFLTNLEKYVLDQTKISLVILEKVMDEDLDLGELSGDVIEDEIIEYNDDYVLSPEEQENYVWTDFYMETRDPRASKSDLYNFFRTRFPYVCNKLNIGEGLYVKKETIENRINLVKSRWGELFYYFDNGTIEWMRQKDLVEATKITTYSELCYKPKNDIANHQFNTWSKLKADNNLNNTIDVNPLLEFMKEIICKGNNDLYKYLITWLRTICKTPWNKTQSVLLFYSPQGTGKGSFVNWLIKHLFGIHNSTYASVNTITQKHNKTLSNKIFLGVDELPTLEKQFHNLFDTLKGLITEPYITIEPKGFETYMIDNLCNFIFMTNNKNSIKIEKSDRRYVVFEISESRIGDFAYWDFMHQQVFTEDMANSFFKYLNEISDDDELVVNLREIPNTKLRDEMKNMSMTNIELFIKDVKERSGLDGLDFVLYGAQTKRDYYGNDVLEKTDICNHDDYKNGQEFIIQKKDLYKVYELWCLNNGEKASKMKYLGNHLEEVRKTDGIRCYRV